MSEERRGPQDLLARMTRREKVLGDQAQSLRAMIRTDASEIAVLDLESTGLVHGDFPVEAGVAIGRGEEPATTYSSIIRPRAEWEAKKLSERPAIHGLRVQDVLCGMEPDAVCDDLDRLLDGRHVFIDGGDHDRYWLARLYGERRPTFTLASLPEEEARQLEIIRRRSTPMHRALPDAVWAYRALRCIRNKDHA